MVPILQYVPATKILKIPETLASSFPFLLLLTYEKLTSFWPHQQTDSPTDKKLCCKTLKPASLRRLKVWTHCFRREQLRGPHLYSLPTIDINKDIFSKVLQLKRLIDKSWKIPGQSIMKVIANCYPGFKKAPVRSSSRWWTLRVHDDCRKVVSWGPQLMSLLIILTLLLS